MRDCGICLGILQCSEGFISMLQDRFATDPEALSCYYTMSIFHHLRGPCHGKMDNFKLIQGHPVEHLDVSAARSKRQKGSSYFPCKQWHLDQSFITLNLDIPLVSLGKWWFLEIKIPYGVCGHFHVEGAVSWSGALCPMAVSVVTAVGYTWEAEHPWAKMGLLAANPAELS